MDIKTQKRNAKKFIENWKNRGHEKQDSQSFWLQLLRDVLGVEEPEQFIKFEKKVQLSHESFIDGYIDQTHVMIEQKGSNKDLDKGIKQSDGSLLTPFQQAQRYANNLPYSERPRWIVTCNFKEFRVYDMEQLNSEPVRIKLKDLETSYYQLEFLVDKSNEHIEKEKQVSLNAGELVGKIYDELLKQYRDPTSENSQKSINQLCVRIVFCLYAEDAGIFGRKNMFHDYLEDFDSRHMRKALINLFKVLDTRIEERDPYLADDEPKLAEFPYVNGGMFSDEDIEIPPFTDELRDLLLSKASDEFDWSEISPTIFGAVFESTLNPDTRRQGGMHYTSVENIHKVIDPLFLNELKDELNEIKKTKQPATLKKKAEKFQDKLSKLTFFDPACGSGNFLTETYLQLRKLENEAIKLIYGMNSLLDTGQNIIKVSIQQFYGIEINDFAVSVAKTALWIAESQMLEETKDIFYADWDFLPLKTYTNIHEGNALAMNWNEVIPNYACHYIMGNPPFIGYKLLSDNQKNDLINLMGKIRSIDYVTGWYYKSLEYIQKTNIKCALVSTNSITQGSAIQNMWEPLSKKFTFKIDFGYQTFIWTSEAKEKAAVHVVIVGFSFKGTKNKFLFDNGKIEKVENITPYLTPGVTVFVNRRSKPLSSVPKMTKGAQLIDGGNFILNKDEEQSLLRDDITSDYVYQYLNASKFLNNSINDEKTYCLYLKNAPIEIIRKNKIIYDKVIAVKEYRENSGAKTTRELSDRPSQYFQSQVPKENSIVVPVVSSQNRRYIPMDFMPQKVVYTNALFFIDDATTYLFGILESNVHMAWMRAIAGRLKSDYRYSNTLVYDNFVWPTPTVEQKSKIERTAQAILDARAMYPNNSLADLYDPITMPKELLKAHQDNDRAVMEAYGLPVKDTTESDAVNHLLNMYKKLIKEKD